MNKFLPPLGMLAALYGGMLAATAAQTIPPPPPPPPAYVAPGNGEAPRDGYPDSRRGNWRNLSPEQRDAIRRLSQEERQAMAGRARGPNGEGAPQGGRLSIEERRQLREQIREEHERRGLRAGGAKRP